MTFTCKLSLYWFHTFLIIFTFLCESSPSSCLFWWVLILAVCVRENKFVSIYPGDFLFHSMNSLYYTVNYKLALTKSIANDCTTKAFAICLWRSNPKLLQPLTFNSPWGSSGWGEALCSRESGGTGLWTAGCF